MPRERVFEIKLDREFYKANVAALIRGKYAVQEEILKRITGKYKITRKELKDRINVWYDIKEMSIYIKLKKGAMPIQMFNPKQLYRMRKGEKTPKGLAVSINRGKRQIIEKGFVIKGNWGNAYRIRKEGKIKNVYGPTIFKIVKDTKFMSEVFNMFKLRYEERLAHELIRRGM